MIHKAPGICFFLIAVFFLASCAGKFGSEVLSSPDEYRHVYEAKEKYILKAIAGVLEEKKIGHNVVIDYANYRVDSDYVVVPEKVIFSKKHKQISFQSLFRSSSNR